MREILSKKVKQKQAFTLMEMLVVVAIMVVLLSISMLAIGDMFRNLKMRELDEYAKTIYLEAQNQLSAKEVEGGLESYYEEFTKHYAERFLTTIPQDYSEDNDDEKWKQLCYITKDDAITKTLISEESDVYKNAGGYIIELNPQTGDIYGVFYWDSNEAIGYDTILSLVDRTAEGRSDRMLGYYGGRSSENATAATALDQQVELINAQELYLKISYDASARLLRHYNSALTIECEVSSQTGDAVWKKTLDTSCLVENADRLECYLLLDSLEYGFGEITRGSGLKPGENISIVVRSTYEKGADLSIESNELDPLIGNSLFGDNTSKNTIEIANLRHLRNLDANYADASVYSRTNGETLTIQITRDIDFLNQAYEWNVSRNEESGIVNASYVGAGKGLCPVTEFEPISNDLLLSNCTVTGLYNDNTYKLQNFIVNGKSQALAGVGMFASTNEVAFTNILIENITVDGSEHSNVGTLVGYAVGGSMTGCGVYLTTYEDVDGAQKFYSKQVDETGVYANDMERRYHTFKISGRNQVGGLCGAVSNVTITDCFAAIKVEAAGDDAGGFIGSMTGGSIAGSYASGDVSGNTCIGGFIGRVLDVVSVTDAYTTSNVYGMNGFGGFLGAAVNETNTNSTYTNCTAYGEVLKKNMGVLNGAQAGGFVYAPNESGNTYIQCKYMTQTGYNKIGLSDPQIIADNATSYKNMVEVAIDNTLGMGASEPYDDTLFGMMFPFAKLPNQSHHYGDWPGEYAIDTSLVYYERYANGAYGYYCVTYIADDEHTWLLNTLKDEICVEDGYALMSKYNLTEFQYDLYIGYAKSDAQPNYSSDIARMDGSVEVSNAPITVVDISSAEAGTSDPYKHAFCLVQQGKLDFKGYPVGSYDAEKGKMADGAIEEEVFSVNGMYIYQLPYDLQTTDRYGIANFYDRLVIRDAKAKGSDTTVIDDMTFFYCPHFAKTAINLAENERKVNVGEVPVYEPRINPTNVFVRSARQLNALGRFPYYWNDKGTIYIDGEKTQETREDILFLQETDINFSTYATGHASGEKIYCGQPFDLTKFGTAYANQPIGQPDVVTDDDSYNYQQFINIYDGQCNIIYDYCVDSNRQFVGLFGEIKDAAVRNVFMLMSDAPTGDAGVISGKYHDLKVYGNNGNQKRTGVGALIGLDYNGNNEIYNCVSAGYTVEYTIHPITDESIYRQPLGIAVGGLIGFGMSDMNSCAANNDVRLLPRAHYDQDLENKIDGAVFLGGFAGSYFYNTITNCYSGGTIDVDWADGEEDKYAIMRLRIGGFCPGVLDTPAENLRVDSAGVQYINIYSYTELSPDVWKIGDASGYDSFGYYFPVVSRTYCTYTEPYESFGGYRGGWSARKKALADPDDGISVPTFAYYITKQQEFHLSQMDSTARGFFEYSGVAYPQTCDGTTYAGLADVETLNQIYTQRFPDGTDTFGRAKVENTYPESKRLGLIAYPYPAYVKNAEGEYVHYGDWPTDEEEVVSKYPVYFEEYTDGTYGLYYLALEKNAQGEEIVKVVNQLAANDSKEIRRTGYGCMSLLEKEGLEPEFTYDIQSGLDGGIYTYKIYERSYEDIYADADTTSKVGSNKKEIAVPFTFETALVSSGKVVNKQMSTSDRLLYVNPNFAAALSIKQGELGTADYPLQVRTPQQFAKVATIHESNVHMRQTHSIQLAKGYKSVSILYSHIYDGGMQEGYQIKNATNTLFAINDGTIQNLRITGSRIESEDNAAIVVNTNAGTMKEITITDARLISSANAAGFSLVNTGTIDKSSILAESSYEDVYVKGHRAYGFVGQNDGVITNSMTVATVQGATRAAGFAASNTNTIRYCYANVTVSVTNRHAQTAGFVLNSTAAAKKLRYCYAAGVVEGYEAYGFLCEGKASDCYTVTEINGAYMYGFAGLAEGNQVDKCYWGYDVKSHFNMEIYRNPKGKGEAIALGRLMRGDAGDDYAQDVSPDYPYTETLGNEYPYPSVGLVHYGDWQPPSVAKQNHIVETEILNDRWKEAGLFYYERYMDGTYGIYAIGMSRYNIDAPEVLINTLASADEPVITSGYGVFYQDNRWNIQRWDDAWWYGSHDINFYRHNKLPGFVNPEGVESRYKFRYLTKEKWKEYYTCTFTYGNNGMDRIISLYAGDFERP